METEEFNASIQHTPMSTKHENIKYYLVDGIVRNE